MKDSLHSIDLFRCESIALRTYWVLVVMDQYTRRIVGFGIQAGIVDGIALCRMFIRAVHGQATPKYVSSDHDPLYRFHQWQANLRILEVKEIKTVPYVPLSHPFVERLIGSFVLDNKTADQPFDERMRQRHIRQRLDFRYLQHAKVRLPLVKPIQRIVVRAEILRQRLSSYRLLEHPNIAPVHRLFPGERRTR